MSTLTPKPTPEADPFACFHPVTAEWFKAVFDAPTAPQRLGWPVIARRESALILAPTGTGKTLTAFLWCLDRLMLHNLPETQSEPSGATKMPGRLRSARRADKIPDPCSLNPHYWRSSRSSY